MRFNKKLKTNKVSNKITVLSKNDKYTYVYNIIKKAV